MAVKTLKSKHALIGDVRGIGLMIALECVSDRNKKAPAAKDVMQKILDGTYDKGVMIRISGNTIILSPPLIITAAHVQLISSALDAGLAAAS